MDHNGRITSVTSEAGLGEAVRTLRRSRGMTQAELARHAGVSRLCVSDLERASRATRTSSLMSILNALRYELDLHPAPAPSDLADYAASFTGP